MIRHCGKGRRMSVRAGSSCPLDSHVRNAESATNKLVVGRNTFLPVLIASVTTLLVTGKEGKD